MERVSRHDKCLHFKMLELADISTDLFRLAGRVTSNLPAMACLAASQPSFDRLCATTVGALEESVSEFLSTPAHAGFDGQVEDKNEERNMRERS